MKHLIALLLKFLLVAVILTILFRWMTNLNFNQILTISLTVAIVTYIVGDLLVMPRSGNFIACLVEAFLAMFTIYIFAVFPSYYGVDFNISLVSASFIGIGVWFHHKFVARYVFPERRNETF